MHRLILLGVAAALLTPAPGTAQVIHNDDVYIQLSDVDLVLEDTSSGGPEYHLNLDETCNNCFAIEDQSTGNEPFIIEQGVRRAALYLDSSGEIGIGTSAPSQELHMVFNSPSIRFETPSLTWDLNANSNGFRVSDKTNNVDAFWIEPPEGYIGMGTGFPQAPLHMRRSDGAAKILVEETGPTAARRLFELSNSGLTGFRMTNTAGPFPWDFFATVQSFEIAEVGDGDGAELRLLNNGNLHIIGSLFSQGPSCAGGCDALFSADGSVESIEQHAEAMWRDGHLPGVGPTAPRESMNVSEKVGGLLNELEKAHIYIEELHERTAALQAENDDLAARLEKLEEALATAIE